MPKNHHYYLDKIKKKKKKVNENHDNKINREN